VKEHTRWVMRSDLSPDAIVAALTTFSDDRARIWRETSHPDVYHVHEVGPDWADVTEGVPSAWSRERYDWSVPGVVTLRQLDSNIAIAADGLIEYRIEPDGTGSVVHCDRRRSFRPTRAGRLAGTYMNVFGSWILRRQFAAGLARVTR
jgi:hypothetical protein